MALTLALGGCSLAIPSGPATFTCTDHICPAGFTCGSDQVCHAVSGSSGTAGGSSGTVGGSSGTVSGSSGTTGEGNGSTGGIGTSGGTSVGSGTASGSSGTTGGSSVTTGGSSSGSSGGLDAGPDAGADGGSGCDGGCCVQQLPLPDGGGQTYGPVDGGVTNVTVPAGVSLATFKVWGAGGGGVSPEAPGGGGGFVSQTYPVTSGDTLALEIGAGGGSTQGYGSSAVPGGAGWAAGGVSPGFGWHGGGGGGASGVLLDGTLLLVAGGGGGGGGGIGCSPGGAGGSVDGVAGGTCGANGTGANGIRTCSYPTQSGGGAGLSGDNGGLGGPGYPGSGYDGGNGGSNPGLGGVGGTCYSGDGLGGGGGGGYVGGGGGGGGGSCVGGGGGGGGSNYVSPSDAGTAVTLAGSLQTPANPCDPDLPPGAAQGALFPDGTGVPHDAGGNGAVVIYFHN
ncbi:MAG: hypothetical protein ACYDCL_12135 [Myxococcales bacterium]